MRPLRRKPKRLQEAPAVFGGGSTPLVVATLDSERREGAPGAPGQQGTLTTGQEATTRDLAELLEDAPVDPQLTSMAADIARRLAVRRRPRPHELERGTGPVHRAPYAFRSDDIDLDATVDNLIGRPHPSATDIVVRERMGHRRSAMLIVDVSGSMRGEKARIAAATVGALAAEFHGPLDRFGMIAFWSDAAIVKPLDSVDSPTAMLERLLRIPARGLTNVGFGLSLARAEMNRAAVGRRTTILLTDAVHNAGPDPRVEARGFSGLHVLLECDGEHDADLGRDLARMGRGGCHSVRHHRAVAPALNRVFARP